ncbi:phage virion morphogenesis protein [Desulfuromonas thiophila]|uniref:Phage virion morphogenesis (Putative tail completion) protein n=1 Tax=Desulfuromonas thiophila TaxID=57664 RepID=A0A1G7FA98_9BACT|nr:phage virion morphogenesis protein [Desulfuromonas thiophila]SDE72425.1 phage virion morphogenesis (putative tail completion) protein [Desulfuromonas thiophila]
MITVTVNDAAVNRQLQALASKVSDLSPVMAGLSEILLEEVRDNLANEHGPTGPWPRLSPRTVLRRALQHKWPGKMLQVSGALKNTLVPGHGARAAWVSAGTRRYAAIHQFGGQAGRGRRVTIPPRPYLHRFIPAGAGNGTITPTATTGAAPVFLDTDLG